MMPSAGRAIAFIFWDAKDIASIDYFQKGKTINGEYYVNLLRQLRKEIKSKQPGKLTKGVLFHQDNAPAHKSVVAMSTEHDCGFELIDQSFHILLIWHHLIIFCSLTQNKSDWKPLLD